MTEIITALPRSLCNSLERERPCAHPYEASDAMKSWLEFLATYCEQNPSTDPANAVLLELLNAKWLHERKRS